MQTRQIDAGVYMNGTTDYLEGYFTNSGTVTAYGGASDTWLSGTVVHD